MEGRQKKRKNVVVKMRAEHLDSRSVAVGVWGLQPRPQEVGRWKGVIGQLTAVCLIPGTVGRLVPFHEGTNIH